MIAASPITRIVIAHRPALVEKADMVLRLDENGLTEISGRRLPGHVAGTATTSYLS